MMFELAIDHARPRPTQAQSAKSSEWEVNFPASQMSRVSQHKLESHWAGLVWRAQTLWCCPCTLDIYQAVLSRSEGKHCPACWWSHASIESTPLSLFKLKLCSFWVWQFDPNSLQSTSFWLLAQWFSLLLRSTAFLFSAWDSRKTLCALSASLKVHLASFGQHKLYFLPLLFWLQSRSSFCLPCSDCNQWCF